MEPENPVNLPLSAMMCPICAASFEFSFAGTFGVLCETGHRFDFAKHGYLNLLSGTASKFTPDSAEMVSSRHDFLAAGHFDPLSAALAQAFAEFAPEPAAEPILVDAGCGTGHYLRGLLNGPAAGYQAIGFDLSPAALRHALRANPELLALVWDLWRPLPLAANSADVVIVVFAPRNAAEFQRILRPEGVLIVVTPLPEHLSGLPMLTSSVGQQPDKREALAAATNGHFVSLAETEIRATAVLGAQEAAQLIMMGPNAHHVAAASLSALDQAEYHVQLGFRISTFSPVPRSAEAPVLRLPRR